MRRSLGLVAENVDGALHRSSIGKDRIRDRSEKTPVIFQTTKRISVHANTQMWRQTCKHMRVGTCMIDAIGICERKHAGLNHRSHASYQMLAQRAKISLVVTCSTEVP